MSHLEQWGRDRQLEQASEVLQPIIQAAQLLQARKTDKDVKHCVWDVQQINR